MFYYHRPSCITWQSRFSVRANGLWVYGAAGRVKTVIQYHTIRHLTVQLSTCDLISSVQSQRNSRSTFFVSLCWQITRTKQGKTQKHDDSCMLFSLHVFTFFILNSQKACCQEKLKRSVIHGFALVLAQNQLFLHWPYLNFPQAEAFEELIPR